MISRLMAIALRREQTAQSALTHQRNQVSEAEHQLTQSQQALDRYRIWRPEEENRLFEQLCQANSSSKKCTSKKCTSKKCTSKELDEFQATLAELQRQENQLSIKVSEAQLNLEQQQVQLEACADDYHRARKKLEKFQEMKSRQAKVDQQDNAQKEELDQEDHVLLMSRERQIP